MQWAGAGSSQSNGTYTHSYSWGTHMYTYSCTYSCVHTYSYKKKCSSVTKSSSWGRPIYFAGNKDLAIIICCSKVSKEDVFGITWHGFLFGLLSRHWEEAKEKRESAQTQPAALNTDLPSVYYQNPDEIAPQWQQQRGFQGNLADTCTYIFFICQFSLEKEIVCSLTPVLLIIRSKQVGFCLVWF